METIFTILRTRKKGLLAFFLCFSFSTVFGQGHTHTESCTNPVETSKKNEIYNQVETIENSSTFMNRFFSKYNFDYNSFKSVNSYFIGVFKYEIAELVIDQMPVSYERIENLLFEAIEKHKQRDALWFEIPTGHKEYDYYGKHMFNPKDKTDNNGAPKTLDCFNAGFESNSWAGWETLCARSTTTALTVSNEVAYSPPSNCNQPVNNTPPQHVLVSGGTDNVGGFPCVFNGGYSAMLGNGAATGGNGVVRQAAVLKKTFIVDASNPIITYSYAAVLYDGLHSPETQPFFNVKLTIDGNTSICAAYSAIAGDGQAGWVSAGSERWYRDWTTIAVPLHNYIGSTVVLEFSVSDCSVDAGSHWAYAYIDVSCDDVEIEQFCEGTSTVLQAPTEGIVGYQWVHSGETTSQVTITEPGNYDVWILPYGSPCSALLTYNASIYPVPTADFSVTPAIVCIGGSLDANSTSTIGAGTSTITGYNWNFGEAVTSGVLVYGNQTSASHVYSSLGDFDVTLSIQTSDGCTTSSTQQVSVIQGPDGAIAGNTVVCSGDTEPLVTFTGSVTAGPYTFTYNVNGGPDQQVTTTPPNASVTVPVPTSPPGNYVYNVTHVLDPASLACQRDLNESVTITVNPLPTATISGATTICQHSASPQITFTGANGAAGTSYQFTYSINGGVHQTVSTSGVPSVTVNVPTSVATTYTYTLHSVVDLTSTCTQVQTGSTVVTINPTPIASIAGSSTICQGGTSPVVTFTGANSSGNYAFSYNVNNGPTQTVTSVGTTATVNQSTAIPGTYVYELTSILDPSTMCSTDTSLTVTIVVNTLPSVQVSAPVEACYLSPNLPVATFEGTAGVAPYTFTYTINGGANQFATSTGNVFTIQVPTNVVGDFIYTVTNVQDNSGCQQNVNYSTMVSINPLPNVSAGDDITVCAGTTIVLTGGGNDAQQYNWDNGVDNGVPFIPTDTTTYTVTGIDHNLCENTDQVTVFVVPIPAMNISGQNLSGCAPVVPTLQNNSTGNLTNCTWYLGNGEVIQGCGTASSVFDTPGCFDVTLVVATPEGCSNSLTLTNYICVDQVPIADFHPNPALLTTYNWESTMVNESVNATSYEWNFGDGSANSYSHSPTHAFPNDEAGIYTVTLVATSAHGCVDTAYATVEVKEELIFYVPNTFTPDNDDFNETFKPIFTTGFDPYNYGLYIYNRWGEMIFESHDTSIGWNGKYGIDSKLCQDGTYTWKIEVKKRLVDEHMQFTGHVNLIR